MTIGSGLAVASGCAMICFLAWRAPAALLMIPLFLVVLGLL